MINDEIRRNLDVQATREYADFLGKKLEETELSYKRHIHLKNAKRALIARLEMQYISNCMGCLKMFGVKSYESVNYEMRNFGRLISESVRDALEEKLQPELTPKEAILWMSAMSNDMDESINSLVELTKLQEGK